MFQLPHLNTKERLELGTNSHQYKPHDVCLPQPIHKAAQTRVHRRLKTRGERTVAYFGRVTFKVPTGRISIDFPQNLFFHLISEYNSEMLKKLK